MDIDHGHLVISLDLELFWGVRDKRSIDSYRRNLTGVRHAVDEMLQLFDEFDTHVTWATVGFLFLGSKEELLAKAPHKIPQYNDKNLNPYLYVNKEAALDSTFHFAPDLIDKIVSIEGQEIATHTFSHYYCLEAGSDVESFEQDILAAKFIANERGLDITSIVFPRNQLNYECLPVLESAGIKCYRGNPTSNIYLATEDSDQNRLKRVLRLLDTYLNLTGHHTFALENQKGGIGLVNLPASRFLRPYSKTMRHFEKLKLNRIKRSMLFAAKNNQVFHLWWHPHNFGVFVDENVEMLRSILNYYKDLHEIYGMRSASMSELANNYK